jgi:hypothetical protein
MSEIEAPVCELNLRYADQVVLTENIGIDGDKPPGGATTPYFPNRSLNFTNGSGYYGK